VPRRRFRSDRPAIAAAGLLVVLVLLAVAAPLVVDIVGTTGPNVRNPATLTAFGVSAGPSAAHPFGVDALGRDVFTRVLYGARVSLEVGLVGAALATALGGVIGVAAAIAPGWLGTLLMGAVEACLAVPAIVLGLGIGAACGADGCAAGLIAPGRGTVIFIVAVAGFGAVARIVSERVRTLSEQAFVDATRSLGTSPSRLLRREILPNLIDPLLVVALQLVPMAILLESALAFLGVGVRPPTPDWGQMIAGAGDAIMSGNPAWWYLVFPGLAVVSTVVAFGLVARALARARGIAATSVLPA
jgi:peptide/nickel transport system permease protein